MSLAGILWKDARVELRGKEGLQAGLVLVALFLLLDVLVFADLADDHRAATIVLWTPLVFAAGAAYGRGIAAEADRGTLHLVRLAPVAPGWHGVSRTIVNGALGFLLAALVLGLSALLFAVPVTAGLVGALALGTLGLVIVGSLVGALAAQSRAREVLLPILLVPVVAPLLQAGLAATSQALTGGPVGTPLLLMAGYDLLAAGVAWLLWPVLLEADP